jgi:hypothetical protein
MLHRMQQRVVAGPKLALLTSEEAIDGDRNEAARIYRFCQRWGRWSRGRLSPARSRRRCR